MNQEQLSGWVNPQSFVQDKGLEILTQDGQVTLLSYEEVKGVHFVREFEEGDRLERKVFTSRPKMDGLWLRLKFKDDEVIEGILPNNLQSMEGPGFTITPPDPYANSQKIYIPRSALAEMTVLGVIGSPVAPRRKRVVSEKQIRLFE